MHCDYTYKLILGAINIYIYVSITKLKSPGFGKFLPSPGCVTSICAP